ncbi:MAG: cyclic nucleotide-binding domain-containing protein [Myxococcales bacterium]|nr:cyclic nucleotide-binding domain-containing protein [Myxococcales bacterium]
MAEIDRATRVKRELFLRVLMPTRPPPAIARQLVSVMKDSVAEPGEIIYEQGTESDAIFFVIDGEVELTSDSEEPWRFQGGSIIGVIDVNLQRPRSRTATALTRTDLLVIKREEWLEIFEDNLEYASQVRQVQASAVHALRQELGADGGFEPKSLSPEEALEAAVVEGTMVERLVALRSSVHFQSASVQALAELAARGETVRVSRGDIVLRPGGAGRGIYFVVAGIVEVERRVAPEIHAAFGPGELVLGGAGLSGDLNEYVVVARTDATLLRLTVADLDDVSEDHFDLTRSFLRAMGLEREQIMNLRARRQRDRARSVSVAPPPAEVAGPEEPAAKRAG